MKQHEKKRTSEIEIDLPVSMDVAWQAITDP